ncbi:ferrochelatase [Beijerinckia indica]|uniref:Ferrochelatase n=1 Tax=Beijerinckia indica subsp. indica (strain ATCC 9039 / DSM 1715 / NCIMB 8712) TaxID=395963 RepID=B2IFD3_BEII9|nr:ferrochelatase [Beijerinckia indica]ACB97033.1 Ferrochelatase [Beijerinckia indica subsp. indica ATCC 9039]
MKPLAASTTKARLTDRIGVLLVNLGTPDATDYWSMRRYLREFLSDRRVVELPRWVWWPILHGIILTTRPHRSGRRYAGIWDKERNESPLKTITRAQGELLARSIGASSAPGDGKAQDIVIDFAMRYGNPSIASGLDRLLQQNCGRILVVPLYPQYAAATTASVADKVFEILRARRWQPALRIAPPYYAEPFYIEALARSVRRGLAGLDFEPDAILLSFHGIPKSSVDKGDPYYEHCLITADLLRQALGLDEAHCVTTFQSRFGRAEWIGPATDATVKALAARGVKKLAVVMPGFAADCLETIEEVGGEIRALFLGAGGEDYAALPCLNASEEGMEVIARLVRRELQGWLTSTD